MNRSSFVLGLVVGVAGLAIEVRAGIVVVGHYTFNDNALPSGFSVVGAGTPTFSGGQMILDGTSAIRNTATPLTATDNFGIEAILTPSANDSFNFFVSNSNGANNGWGLLSIDGAYRAIAEGAGVFGTGGGAATVDQEVRLALVRAGGTATLYVNNVAVSGTTGAERLAASILTIGVNQQTNEPAFEGFFKGSINEVRLFTFEAGAFSVSDLLTQPTPVPEPSGIALLAMSLAGLGLVRRRHR